MTDNFRCGFVALVGRTNAGKSTLVNALTEQKVSITSHKVQTTRNNIRAIVNVGKEAQIVFVDTPGIHLWLKRALNQVMFDSALAALHDSDCTVMLIDAHAALDGKGNIPELELLLVENLKKAQARTILAINKVDLLESPNCVLPIIEKYSEIYPFEQIIPLSALKKQQLDTLTQAVVPLLPVGPQLYPDDLYTDQAERFLASEIIRETILKQTQKEIPYSTVVVIDDFKENAFKNLIEITCTIFVERESQKAILIGKRGAKIKDLGSHARESLSRIFGSKIILNTTVKVKENWAEDMDTLRKFGYSVDTENSK